MCRLDVSFLSKQDTVYEFTLAHGFTWLVVKAILVPSLDTTSRYHWEGSVCEQRSNQHYNGALPFVLLRWSVIRVLLALMIWQLDWHPIACWLQDLLSPSQAIQHLCENDLPCKPLGSCHSCTESLLFRKTFPVASDSSLWLLQLGPSLTTDFFPAFPWSPVISFVPAKQSHSHSSWHFWCPAFTSTVYNIEWGQINQSLSGMG